MLSRFTVITCASMAVVGGKLRFLSGETRDLRHCIFIIVLLSRREVLSSFLRRSQQFWVFGSGVCSSG